MRKRITLRLTIVSTFLVATSIIIAVALSLQYYFAKQMAREAAAKEFVQVAEKVSFKALQLEQAGVSLTRVLGQNYLVSEYSAHNTFKLIKTMAEVLQQQPELYNFFVAFDSGHYTQLVNLEAAAGLRENFQASPLDRWLQISVEPDGTARKMIKRFYDAKLNLRTQTFEDTDYDVNNRPWYVGAKKNQVTRTPPYFFLFAREPGITYSLMTDSGAVVGVDIVLSTLSNTLQSKVYPKSSDAFIFNRQGTIVVRAQSTAFEEQPQLQQVQLTAEERAFVAANPVIQVANEMDYPPFDFSVSGIPAGYFVDLLSLVTSYAPLQFEYINGFSFTELMEQFNNGDIDLMTSMSVSENRKRSGIFSLPIVGPNMVAVTRESEQQNIVTLSQLSPLRIAVSQGYMNSLYLQENYPQYAYVPVASTIEAMQRVQQNQADITIESLGTVNFIKKYYFMDDLRISEPLKEFEAMPEFGFHFYAQPHQQALISILQKAIDLIPSEKRQALEDKWITATTNRQTIANNAEFKELPHSELLQIAQDQSRQQQLQRAELAGKQYVIYVEPMRAFNPLEQQEFLGLVVSEDEVMAPYLYHLRISLLITIIALVLIIPLVLVFATHIVKPIRALISENNKIKAREFNQVTRVDTYIKEIDQLSRSLVNMANSIDAFQAGRKNLMNAFIQVLAEAIDQKSPYTAGHCERVPQLAIMLAEAASKDNQQFAHFKLSNEDEWREFSAAAWLRDCGKITTPEYLMDKGSKLETVYNRIHEIRMRFELLWREAEVQYWKSISGSPENASLFKKQLQQTTDRLTADFAFVAACNVGSEHMEKADIQRLEQIAQQQWKRNFDDRMGLSPAESMHLADQPSHTPSYEKLLSDKPQHLYAHRSIKQGDEKYAFTMQAPKYRQNQGELHNLSVRTGTLTAEDRYVINEHIITTIQMLETLPFPDDLQRVPEYASGHRETMDGKGYPRGLKKQQISVPARIIAIADIFEALTAADRPYKQAKSLSESLDILHQMSKKQHIDSDLFKLFLTSGVYLQYAEKFLHPDQIDAVDIKEYFQ